MAAISAPPPVDLEVAARPRPRVHPGAIAVAYPPAVRLRPPVTSPARRSAQTRATNLLASVLLNMLASVAVASVVYTASGFWGNVQLSAAAREARQSTDRAGAASASESGLRRSVDMLVADDTIQRWALFNKFQPPFKLTPTANVEPEK